MKNQMFLLGVALLNKWATSLSMMIFSSIERSMTKPELEKTDPIRQIRSQPVILVRTVDQLQRGRVNYS